MICRKGFEIEILKSAAGCYIGTRDKEGFPNCRISGYCEVDYFSPLLEENIDLFANRQTGCIENEYCNGGEGCFNV